MFKSNEKKRIYYLIDLYLAGQIDTNNFTNEYCKIYDFEIDYNLFTPKEHALLRELCKIAERHSPFQSDYQSFPGVYFTEEVRKKTIETKKALASEN